jgi:hypothetical protein
MNQYVFYIFVFTLKKKKIGLNCKNYGNDSDIKPLYINKYKSIYNITSNKKKFSFIII